MAKGQKKSNREIRKPKKTPVAAATELKGVPAAFERPKPRKK